MSGSAHVTSTRTSSRAPEQSGVKFSASNVHVLATALDSLSSRLSNRRCSFAHSHSPFLSIFRLGSAPLFPISNMSDPQPNSTSSAASATGPQRTPASAPPPSQPLVAPAGTDLSSAPRTTSSRTQPREGAGTAASAAGATIPAPAPAAQRTPAATGTMTAQAHQAPPPPAAQPGQAVARPTTQSSNPPAAAAQPHSASAAAPAPAATASALPPRSRVTENGRVWASSIESRVVQCEAALEAAEARLATAARPPEAPAVPWLPTGSVTSKPVPLPDPVIGHVGDSFKQPLSRKILTTFEEGTFCPWTLLVPRARSLVADDTEDFTWTATGITARGFDRHADDNISAADWHQAARQARKVTKELCSPLRYQALCEHIENVTDVAAGHGWPVARRYDILQRLTAANDKRHYIGTMNEVFLLQVGLQAMQELTTQKRSADAPAPSAPAVKRPRAVSASPASSHCFRCGHLGHLPGTCSASTTTAGKPVAPLVAGSRNPNALSVDGADKAFCFNFAKRSACTFGASCKHAHSCSVCQASDHGAGKCPRANRA